MLDTATVEVPRQEGTHGTKQPALDIFASAHALLKRIGEDEEFNRAASELWEKTEEEVERAGAKLFELAHSEDARKSFWESALELFADKKEDDE